MSGRPAAPGSAVPVPVGVRLLRLWGLWTRSHDGHDTSALVHHSDGGVSTSPSATPSASPRPASSSQSEARATATTAIGRGVQQPVPSRARPQPRAVQEHRRPRDRGHVSQPDPDEFISTLLDVVDAAAVHHVDPHDGEHRSIGLDAHDSDLPSADHPRLLAHIGVEQQPQRTTDQPGDVRPGPLPSRSTTCTAIRPETRRCERSRRR